MKIIPAILSNSPSEVKEMLYHCQDAGVERVHIDIIDGVFADNKTIDPSVLETIETSLKIDFHLMVKEPIHWVERCIRAGADRIIGQIEMMNSQKEFIANREIHKLTLVDESIVLHTESERFGMKLEDTPSVNSGSFIEKVAGFGVEVGLALDLQTQTSRIDENIINDLDVVLVMSVRAGFGGQEFDFKVLDKIRELNRIREKDITPFKICDDGGVTTQNIDDVQQLKVDEVAIGRKIFDGNLAQNIRRFISASKGS